ncbi:MAG: hypothetical protein EOO16_23050 [Chitinophagaceae bacterium]|nr:MAG: hypothetical protein EOO16_23050 [Chitinophagaceae bacterium]
MEPNVATTFRPVLRPGGPLLLAVPHLLLLALVLYLFVQLYRSCTANRRGSESADRLMQRLLQLERQFENGRSIDPRVERRELEALLNKVKVSNSSDHLTDDRLLRYHVTRSFNLVSERSLRVPPADRVPWTQLESLLQEFYGRYFSVLTGPREEPASAPAGQRVRSQPGAGPKADLMEHV